MVRDRWAIDFLACRLTGWKAGPTHGRDRAVPGKARRLRRSTRRIKGKAKIIFAFPFAFLVTGTLRMSATDSGTGTDMDSDGTVGITDFNLFLPGFQAGAPGP